MNDLPFIIRADVHGARSREAEELRRRCDRGELHRLLPGCFVPTSVWDGLRPPERHQLLLRALWPRLGPDSVVARVSAAVMFGWSDVDSLPSRVHVIDPTAQKTSTRRRVVCHAESLAAGDVWAVGSIRLSSPLRTAVDMALTSSFATAVAALDSALQRADVTREGLLAHLHARPKARGRVAAHRAIEFADGRAGSAAESFARVVLFELGAPAPELQWSFPLQDPTRSGAVDFFFGEQGVVLEVDGRGKYTDRQYLRGSTAADAFISEKEREHALFARPEVRRIIRCGWSELRDPARLREMLVASGVPVRS